MATKTELMRAVIEGRAIESFTLVPDNGDPEVTYNITLLREMLKNGKVPGARLITIPMEAVVGFLKGSRVWEEARCHTLTPEQIKSPAIALVEENNGELLHTFVDGTHRVIRADMEGEKTVSAWEVPEHLAPRVVKGMFYMREDWGTPLSSLVASKQQGE